MSHSTEKLALRDHPDDSFDDISSFQLDAFIKQNESYKSSTSICSAALSCLTRRRMYLAIIGAFILVSLFLASQEERLASMVGSDSLGMFHKSATSSLWRQDLRQQLARSNTTVVALLFYGRRESVSILNSYIERNLQRNGGILDRVEFVSQTNVTRDLEYLETIVARNPKEYVVKHIKESKSYSNQYEHLDPNTLYIKIDDDVVFVSEEAIDALAAEKLKRPHNILSANVVNHPLLTHVHARLGAVHPFIRAENSNDATGNSITYVPFRDQNRDGLDGTAAEHPGYHPFDPCTLQSWECAAVAHYSLFENVRNNTLEIYDFGIWDFHVDWCERWSINFLTFYGHEILDHLDIIRSTSDERAISAKICEVTGRHSYAIGKAIVAHYAFFPQRKGLAKTDVLSKYRELAIQQTGYVID